MTSRAGRVAIIAAAFGVQAAMFAGIGGLASVSGHTEAGYAAQGMPMPVMAPLPVASGLPDGAVTITMGTEGQIGFAALPGYDSGQAAPLQSASFQLTPGMDADVQMVVNIPDGYPVDSFTIGLGPAQVTGPGAPLSMNPLLTVTEPGPGTHQYRFTVPAQLAGSGENLMMKVQNAGQTPGWYPLAQLPAS